MIHFEMFLTFFQIGLFSIGGGYAVLPMIQTHIVEAKQWLTLSEFTDVVTISQMTPGPIAINAATFVGTKVAGLSGAIAATLGCVTPSFIIVLTLAYIYTKYRKITIIQGTLGALRPAVVGLIAASGLSITILTLWNESAPARGLSAIDAQAAILFVAGLFLLRKFKLNPVYIMLGSGVVGLGLYFLRTV